MKARAVERNVYQAQVDAADLYRNKYNDIKEWLPLSDNK